MKLPTTLLLFLPSTLVAIPVPPPRQASFASLLGLTTLTRDHSTPSKHASKFFNEASFHSHYDGRFASSQLPSQARAVHLRLLVKTYMSTMARLGVRTWIVHGSLLGWWWNGGVLPWDSDVDVMVDERGMAELGGWWGLSVHCFSAEELHLNPEKEVEGTEEEQEEVEGDLLAGLKERDRKKLLKEGKKYLLEVNPHFVNKDVRDRFNVIDARWIDTQTGLFIDVTTVHAAPGDEEEMFTKDSHAYSRSQLFPLREATFEGVKVNVPYAYEQLLLDEYGPRALTKRWFKGYEFDGREWVEGGRQRSVASEEKGREKGGVGHRTVELTADGAASSGAGGNGDALEQTSTRISGNSHVVQ